MLGVYRWTAILASRAAGRIIAGHHLQDGPRVVGLWFNQEHIPSAVLICRLDDPRSALRPADLPQAFEIVGDMTLQQIRRGNDDS